MHKCIRWNFPLNQRIDRDENEWENNDLCLLWSRQQETACFDHTDHCIRCDSVEWDHSGVIGCCKQLSGCHFYESVDQSMCEISLRLLRFVWSRSAKRKRKARFNSGLFFVKPLAKLPNQLAALFRSTEHWVALNMFGYCAGKYSAAFQFFVLDAGINRADWFFASVAGKYLASGFFVSGVGKYLANRFFVSGARKCSAQFRFCVLAARKCPAAQFCAFVVCKFPTADQYLVFACESHCPASRSPT